MTPPPSKLLRPEERLRLEATPTRIPHSDEATLVDALDHLLNRGAVLVGEAVISLADVELVYVGLNLLVSSVETLREASPPMASPPRPLSSGAGEGEDAAMRRRSNAERERAHADPLPVWAGPAGAPQPATGEGIGVSSSPLSISRPEGHPEGAGMRQGDERPEQGLARLVLTLVELLRQTLERQAIRRMEGGDLAEEEIERMGVALLDLEQKMVELRKVFNLEEADLKLDLGPLGRLL